MRHNQNRRSRGRSRKGPNPLTRSYESNGPDVKVRGTAAHIAEKYTSLARDAQASGDIVAVESYLQHAEHYNRIVMAAQAQLQQSQPQYREGADEGYDDRGMNGRGRDRFDYNGDGRDDDEDGDDDAGDRFRQSRPRWEDQDRQERQQRPPRQDRGYQARERNDDDDDDRDEAPDAQQPQPVIEARPEAEARPAEEPQQEKPPAPRRRRARPRPAASEGAEAKDGTPDGAAALAAFPD